ncbi:J domain-containing protein [Mycena indigotica]|uniref:J domain-containing protein n=1 Tax=Mycena indigotica TaxID=2126181 RepID=A0A8H6WF16_9AGAR|nr:J domain-containing protein [Mycena indigotica]KAF7312423.1 J domain-containing protein [Mycena indigotica]
MASADVDIEKLLSRETNALQREIEVERILKAFKLNPYDVLDIDESSTPEELKKRYKQLSLFIHPDKCHHARAPEAFDTLKKAESELSDETKRQNLDAIVTEARAAVLKAHGLPATTNIATSLDVRQMDPPFKVQMRAKSKELLIEEELRRRKAIKMNLANEGHEARQKEAEVESKKRKAEDDKAWEERREERVDSWRSFSSGKGSKKKKAKVTLLG